MILCIILFDDLNDNVFVTIVENFQCSLPNKANALHYCYTLYVCVPKISDRCRENKQIKYNS